MRQPVRPIGQFFVRAPSAIADQRDVVAKPALNHAVCQLDRGVQSLGILEFGPVEQEIRPLVERREIVAGEGVDVRGRPKLDVSSHVSGLRQMKVQILQ
jgi:hypothetical protein